MDASKDKDIDNIDYIESYIPYKFDPIQFLNFFE